MFVKATINPETGQPFVIRQPERMYRLLPNEGAEVPNNRFYRQHIKDGSLIVAQEEHIDLVIKGDSQ